RAPHGSARRQPVKSRAFPVDRAPAGMSGQPQQPAPLSLSAMIFSPLLRWTQRTSLVAQIALALVAGVALAVLLPGATPYVAFLGTLFISALKAVAPVLVLVLVMAAISNHVPGEA